MSRSDLSGESRLALLQSAERLIAGLRCKSVILGLEPGKFCLQVADSLLQAAHLRDHSRVRTADVAE
ncbi:hypothetical protein H4W81_005693 [Nonomuraea africana]|uniref:Uncharacterized protein n=1 Tax=Nonomuraea africana TaxID=46171 RepID=A0ABR9KLM0_9ACTN|nr:hypothetical protein [Nonomuraea africana]